MALFEIRWCLLVNFLVSRICQECTCYLLNSHYAVSSVRLSLINWRYHSDIVIEWHGVLFVHDGPWKGGIYRFSIIIPDECVTISRPDNVM